MIRIYLVLILFNIFLIPAQSQVMAYHPNKYWNVAGQPAPDNPNFPFREIRPQFGYPMRLENGKLNSMEWVDWMKQNRFQYSYLLAGHAWQAVIMNNQEYLKKHPDFFAEVNGIRGKSNKFCVSNKQFQKFFIQDRLRAFEAIKNPEASISVEPSDGAGFCECDDCKKMGSISNQVFYLANITAKAIRQKYPNGKVNLYAYYMHAQLPTFDLEPNVHVTVIPEGFQNFYDADVMLALWAKKAKLKTYYEYFAIPQWKGEQPRIHIDDFIRRMQMAKNLGYQGYWFETGMNINVTIALQLFNQLWLRQDATWEQVSEEFLRACFRDSYQPMKQLFTRWWHTWMPDDEIGMALHNLNEASKLARNKDEKERINDLKAYVHYLVLYQEWNKDRNDPKRSKEYFDYLVQSESRMIVHSNALLQMFYKYQTPEQLSKYKHVNSNNWSWVKKLDQSAIENNFRKDLKNYGVTPNKFEYVNIHQGLNASLKAGKTLKEFKWSSKVTERILIYASGDLSLQLINPVDVASENDKGMYINITGIDGKFVHNQFLSYNKPDLTIRLPEKNIYIFSLKQFFSTDLKIKGNFIPVLNADQYKAYLKNVKQTVKKNENNKEKSYYFITD